MRWNRWVLALGGLFGCDADGDSGPYERGSLEREVGFPGTPGDEAAHAGLFAATPYADPVCNEVVVDLGIRREIRIFHHPSQADRVQRVTQGLARYYRRYGIEFFTRHPALPVPLDWVLDTDPGRLEQHLKARFPDVDFTAPTFEGSEEELTRIYEAAFEFTGAPMLDFARTYGDQGEQVTHVVLVPGISLGERIPPEADQPLVAGLALSPALRERLEADVTSSDAQFWRYFPLQGSFTPMMFINIGLLDAVVDRGADEVIIDLVVAHEFGHTTALQHVSAPFDNLMLDGLSQPEQLDCRTWLDDEQLATAQSTLEGDGVGKARSLPSNVDMWNRLREHLAGRGSLPFVPLQ